MPLASELTSEDLKRYRETARRRVTAFTPTPAERAAREALLRRVRETAAVLKRQFGARQVILFGSLAHQAWFASDSDVDLVVEGLRGSAYWQAWRVAEEMIGDREVDLIELETASDSLRQAIQRYGVTL
jgi:predicted nucleotidyltransferase